ncbi:hypothetical protein [Xenorhabdus sp. NBAII XenSa04]|uniref:hypothetical protein n=2 Tax=Morganellaceae TaxID=1903414 RepID=UPI001E556374|nr:hypothetical protein [Xenorhabdus sp. NBAII XenSa04]
MIVNAMLFSANTLADRVSIAKPFICPDISPLPQHITAKGNLVIEGKVYLLWIPNAAAVIAPLTNTIWISEDGRKTAEIHQHKDGRVEQAFVTFSTNIKQLPYNVDVEQYITDRKHSYMEGGQGCFN